MFGVGNVNGLACPRRHEYLHGGLVVAAGAAVEGFSNVRVRFDFPARNGLTKFGVAELPGIERFAADTEKVGELLVGQSEQAHPIRALGKLRSISTRTPNAARGAVRLAPARFFRTGFRVGDVHRRTGNKRGFPCVLHHRDTRSYMAPFRFPSIRPYHGTTPNVPPSSWSLRAWLITRGDGGVNEAGLMPIINAKALDRCRMVADLLPASSEVAGTTCIRRTGVRR